MRSCSGLKTTPAGEACATWYGSRWRREGLAWYGSRRRREGLALEGLWQPQAPGFPCSSSGSCTRREAGWATRMPRKHQRRRRNVVADEGTAYGLL